MLAKTNSSEENSLKPEIAQGLLNNNNNSLKLAAPPPPPKKNLIKCSDKSIQEAIYNNKR